MSYAAENEEQEDEELDVLVLRTLELLLPAFFRKLNEYGELDLMDAIPENLTRVMVFIYSQSTPETEASIRSVTVKTRYRWTSSKRKTKPPLRPSRKKLFCLGKCLFSASLPTGSPCTRGFTSSCK